MICLQCGDCCVRFEIPEINKPPGVRCQYLNEKNRCKIYKDRPEICRNHNYPFSVCPVGQNRSTKTAKGKCLNCGSMLFETSDFCDDNCRENFAMSLKGGLY